MARKPLTPTTLTATKLADHLAAQTFPLRGGFGSGVRETAIGSRLVHDGVWDIIRALRAGDIAPVVAQVRLLPINRTACRYNVRTISAHPAA
jgi:hypothetical protein